MTSAIPALTAKEIGTAIEEIAAATVPGLEHVAEDVARWHDAVALVDVVVDDVRLERGDPVEIKGAALRTGDGSGSVRGRYYLKRRAHDRLLLEDGAYLLVIYREDLEILTTAIVPAATVDEVVAGRWSTVEDSGRTEREVAKPSWREFFDPETVEEGSA